MKKNNTVGYEAFAKSEVNLARGKARGLVGKYGFTTEDIPDLEQELLLAIHCKRDAMAKLSDTKATWRTITSRILDNHIRDIIDDLKRDKRCINTRLESLDDNLPDTGEADDSLNYADILDEDLALARRGRKPIQQEEELRLALSLKLAILSDSQRNICALLMDGFNVSEIAESLGIGRTTLCREIKRMRKLFYENGLHEYL